MANSEFAILLAAPSADEDDNPNDDAVAWCDSKLQEVREVLYLSRRRLTPDGPCWCEAYMQTLPHEEDCQRARVLMGRLAMSDLDGKKL